MSLNPALTTELQKLAPSAVIELFELDVTALGGEVLRFHAGTNELAQNIVWNGNTYIRYPIRVEGFEFTGQGQFPRPKLLVSNLFSAITLITAAYGDLLGAKLTRIRTMKKFLDAVNFDGGVNPDADPTAQFEPDVYFVDRKSMEDRDAVEFELASSCDLVNVKLPRRQIVQNICPWVYRSSECGYTGPPVFDANDELITSASTSEGQALLAAYNTHVAAAADLAVKEAALTAAAQAKDVACAATKLSTHYDFTPPTEGPTGTTPGVYTNVVIVAQATGQVLAAYFGGVVVSLGSTYVKGAWREDVNTAFLPTRAYEIEVWGFDSGGCSSATSDYTTALADRDSAQAAVTAAIAAYEAALAALPPSDPLYLGERCGKRLSSCKLRFGQNGELPFGSFPSVGLFR